MRFARYAFALFAVLPSAFAATADCSVARDPRRCEAMQAAHTACAGLPAEAHAACLRDALPPPDCTHAPNAAQCERRQAAEAACQNVKGKARKRCVKDYLTQRRINKP